MMMKGMNKRKKVGDVLRLRTKAELLINHYYLMTLRIIKTINSALDWYTSQSFQIEIILSVGHVRSNKTPGDAPDRGDGAQVLD